MAKKVLILFAHPALHKSKVNRAMMDAVRNIENVTIHDLYERYPDFHIDIAKEQAYVEAHDVIVMHHPLFWYSCPPLLKEWFDLVLTLGWAYGPGGNALKNKMMLSAISTGGSEEAYQPTGKNRYTLPQLLAPFDQTAFLCGMHYLKPVIFSSAHSADTDRIKAHAAAYRQTMIDLRDGLPFPLFEQDWGSSIFGRADSGGTL